MINEGAFPQVRLRRPRQSRFLRQMCQETQLSSADLIYPLFICEGHKKKTPIEAMPDQFRYSIDVLVPYVEEIMKLGIRAIALFPVIEKDRKTLDAREAFNPEGLVQKAVRTLKAEFPELLLISDVALDPYTSHGQDGLINEDGVVLNDETVQVLQKQALSHGEAGVDIVAPSDMMDGRIGAIRSSLDECALTEVCILSYAAKYASSFYGPFRDAVGSAKSLGNQSKASYQMNPGNKLESLREVRLDLQEGADFVMVKPASIYLDVIHMIKTEFKVPTLAYHVSGEYAMIHAASQRGWLDLNACAYEATLSIKRAGADAILTYFAPSICRYLNDMRATS